MLSLMCALSGVAMAASQATLEATITWKWPLALTNLTLDATQAQPLVLHGGPASISSLTCARIEILLFLDSGGLVCRGNFRFSYNLVSRIIHSGTYDLWILCRTKTDVELPSLIVDARCSVKIDSTTPASSVSTWYELWEAVNAISYMCVRQKEKGGKATRAGT